MDEHFQGHYRAVLRPLRPHRRDAQHARLRTPRTDLGHHYRGCHHDPAPTQQHPDLRHAAPCRADHLHRHEAIQGGRQHRCSFWHRYCHRHGG